MNFKISEPLKPIISLNSRYLGAKIHRCSYEQNRKNRIQSKTTRFTSQINHFRKRTDKRYLKKQMRYNRCIEQEPRHAVCNNNHTLSDTPHLSAVSAVSHNTIPRKLQTQQHNLEYLKQDRKHGDRKKKKKIMHKKMPAPHWSRHFKATIAPL